MFLHGLVNCQASDLGLQLTATSTRGGGVHLVQQRSWTRVCANLFPLRAATAGNKTDLAILNSRTFKFLKLLYQTFCSTADISNKCLSQSRRTFFILHLCYCFYFFFNCNIFTFLYDCVSRGDIHILRDMYVSASACILSALSLSKGFLIIIIVIIIMCAILTILH